MSLLDDTVARIAPPDGAARAALLEKLNGVMPKSEGLGVLRDMLCTYADTVGSADLPPTKKLSLIACADHGVAKHNVSAYPQKTTLDMTANYLISRGGAANAMAAFAGAELIVVDMGINADTSNLPGIIDRRIASGTKDSTVGAAMTRDEAVRAVETGIALVEEYAAQGFNVFLPGEMGIANTTASAAITAALCLIDPAEATGRGTGLVGDDLRRKTDIVRRIIEVNVPDSEDGLDVLAKVGGFELACITGIILGAAANRKLVILDGFNTGAAALVAAKIAPQCMAYTMASSLSDEEGHRAILEKLGLSTFMTLHLRLGEACASSVAAVFLDAALEIFNALTAEAREGFPKSSEEFMQETLEDVPETLSDATFNFYTNTMPEPDKTAMARCRMRLDDLAKPRHSMGFLEEIAAQTAGILSDERPDVGDMSCGMLLFFDAPRELGEAERRITSNFVETSCDELTMFPLDEKMLPAVAFGCGRAMGEDVSFRYHIVGLSLWEKNAADEPGTMARRLKEALLDEKGRICGDPDTMLGKVPRDLRSCFAAIIGAIISAAHNSSLIVADDEATEIIARCAQKICPDVRPYILHVQPKILQMGIKYSGGITAILGTIVVNAALCMLNDMKTCAEAGVSQANIR